MTPREALEAAARVCREVATDGSLRPGMEAMPALYCAERILALAEQLPAERKCAAKHGYCVPCGGSTPMGGGCWKKDQRGAAACSSDGRARPARHSSDGSSVAEPLVTEVAGSIPASQSAPHPDPAGQVPVKATNGDASSEDPWSSFAALPLSDCGNRNDAVLTPALPGPDSVSVPRESMELLLDLLPRISDDDPMAPALADWCRGIRKAMLAERAK